MLWARLRTGDGRALAVANVHGSVPGVPGAAGQVLAAAALAVEWAAADPLVFGGDLNLRPRSEPDAFERLRDDLGLAPPTAAHAIDHLLVRGLERVDPPHELPPETRELPAAGGLRLQLSDHPSVALVAGMK